MTDPLKTDLEKLCGPVVDAEAVEGKASEFAAFLAARDDTGAALLEIRQSEARSWVVVEFELDVGQLPVVAVARRERVAVGFSIDDRDWPTALVLRDDFPSNLPHTFLVNEGAPTLLCLSEEPWSEAKRRWSPNMLVRTIRHWFNETAKGGLHKDDQALEPFVVGSMYQAILPANYAELCAASPALLYGYGVEGAPIIRFFGQRQDSGPQAEFTAVHFEIPPQTHGFIRHSAPNVAQLIKLFTVDGFDFKARLIETVRTWLNDPRLRGTRPVIIVSVPTSRVEGGPVERVDTRLFLLDANVKDLGLSLDLWSAAPDGTFEGPTIGKINAAFDGSLVAVNLLSTLEDLTRERAARYNGYDGPSGKPILVVGAGALGSQVIGNLVRMGETVIGVADQDLQLPHNLARHGCYSQQAIGMFKSRIGALQANDLLSGPVETSAFTLDVLRPSGPDVEHYQKAMQEAAIVLDLAASVAVSRHLSSDHAAPARRICAFLSPSGHDLVLLVEDAARTVRLDDLEMAYYAAVAGEPALTGHLFASGRIRYGQSCRDLSSRIEQSHVAICAGIAAKAIREAITQDKAVARVWRTDPATLTVTAVEIDNRPMEQFNAADWTILVRPGLIDAIADRRSQRLPYETGGVLLGDFDTSRRRIYLVDVLATPADSREERGSFIRGSFGLPEAVEEVEAKTQQMLRYVGEWHSHPTGYGVMPSADDVGLYGYMAAQMEVEGYPPIMMIAGDNEFSLIVERQRIALDPQRGT